MKNITVQEFRDILDDEGLTSKKVDDNVLAVPFPDEENGINFVINFVVEEDRIQIWSCIPGLGVEIPRVDALEFCNRWNKEMAFPKVYIDRDRDIIAEHSLLTDEEISEEFLKLNVVTLSIGSIHKFLITLNKFSETGVFEP